MKDTMNDNFNPDQNIAVKTLPFGGDSAELRFACMAGSDPSQISAHAELLKASAPQNAMWVGPEIYGGADLDISCFPNAGETSFIGTQTGTDFYRGVQACAISGMNAKPIELDGNVLGVCYEDSHARYALLGGLLPRNINAKRGAQTRDVFELMEEVLESVDMDFSHVGRTWFYNDDILDWYGEFNRARDVFFNERGIFERLVPASTGVGSRNRKGAALMARAFAVMPKDVSVHFEAVSSPMQCPAPDYRSSFSRAVELMHPCFRHLSVSGTASIEPGGLTAHVGDIDRQIELTLDVVEAILKSRNMRWDDTVRSVAYLKDFSYASNFLTIAKQRGLEKLPCVWVQSDVCRDDLLFELELDAVLS